METKEEKLQHKNGCWVEAMVDEVNFASSLFSSNSQAENNAQNPWLKWRATFN